MDLDRLAFIDVSIKNHNDHIILLNTKADEVKQSIV